MATQLKQALRQTQSAVMTQKLQEAIKLLQLSSAELAAVIENEVEKNPFLDFEEHDSPESAKDERPAAQTKSPTQQAIPDRKFDSIFSVDASGGGVAPPMPRSGWKTASGQAAPAPDVSVDERLPSNISLREHLMDQIALSVRDPVQTSIAQHLVDAVDEAGYLRASTRDVADELDVDEGLVEDTLNTVQAFDPPGVFARSLSECLTLQLQDRGLLDPAMQTLIANLDALADGKRDWLMEELGAAEDEFLALVGRLRELDPRPGLQFDPSPTQTVVPDIVVRKDANDQWIVELNPDTLPSILVDKDYYAQIKGRARTKEEKAYLSERISTANWLLKSLEQRSQTILAVAREIVRQQLGFFMFGISHMKPLTLREIAEEVDCHESTVSRVTANKYLMCPTGVFSLKYFFSPALPSTDGRETYAAVAVREQIREIVANEKPDAILSDEKIARHLREDGIDIARRTVTKYREALRIPSSVQRRRQKASKRGEA